MKRIFVLCIACMVLFAGVASAEVLRGKDNFTNGISIGSFINAKPMLSHISLKKEISDDVRYELTITISQMKKYLLLNAPIELKIDSFSVCVLNDYKYKMLGPDSYGVEYVSSITSSMPTNIVEEIKNAKRVALRCENNDGLKITYVLPDNVLSEWKQVIEMEK